MRFFAHFFVGLGMAALLLALAEGALRVGGFQFRQDLSAPILEPDSNGNLVLNNQLPVPGVLLVPPRRANETRVLVFGESSVFNLGKMEVLRERLAAKLGRPVTPINAGFSSWGTERLRQVLPALLPHADVVVFYLGHNEWEESPPDEAARGKALAALSSLRLFQLTELAVFRAGMATVRAYLAGIDAGMPLYQRPRRMRDGSDRLDKEKLYARFERNVRAMLDAASAAGKPVAISTVSYNLRNFRGPVGNWVPHIAAGHAAYSKGQWKEAREELEKGHELDDMDPHAATARTNRILMALAKERGIPTVDLHAAFAAASPHGIPDENLFDDRVHANRRGREIQERLLADAAAAALAKGKP